MLLELRIQNYAVIDHAALELEPGLTVLSGETGTGKSLVAGALSLLMGERASADVVRAGARRAVVEGVFDIAGSADVLALLHEQGIAAEDGLLILRREVAAEGRNRAWINGSAATATLVGQLGRGLVDLHGQHEHQTLLRPDEQRAIVDAYAGAVELAEAVHAAHEQLAHVRRQLGELERRREAAEERSDLLRFQADEIEQAKLREDEEQALVQEAHRLEHSADLARLSGQLHETLYGGEGAISETLGELRRVLGQLTRMDPAQADAQELLDAAFYNVEELGRRMGDYAAAVENEPARLDEIRRRQDLIFRLKTKYGPTLGEVIAAGARAREQLDSLDRVGFERQALERELAEAADTLAASATQLTECRTAAADRLAHEVATILPELGLTDGRFEVALLPHGEIRAYGAEAIEFRIALNLGFESRPLGRIVSGGELSRIMLALKTVLARLDRVPSLVFDEVDVGIGGRVAHHVAEKLRDVAAHRQVFVITHLAQIAARADHHLRVEKAEHEGTTATRVTSLQGDERVRELARMLGGDPESETSLEHGRELMELGVRAGGGGPR